jgi:hypothetical protein
MFAAKGGSIPKGRVSLYGPKSGLYLDDGSAAWSIYSDADSESGGVCLMTSYQGDVKGLKVCHTDQSSGMWASGNAGVTGNLMLDGNDAEVDVQRLHLHQTGMNHGGYVLKVGGGSPTGPAVAAGVSEKSAWMHVTGGKPLALNVAKGNVGFGTVDPKDKMHVGGTMAVENIFVGHTAPIFTENQLILKSGTGWEMTDATWMRVIGDRGIETQAGAYFTQNVGVNFNWKTQPPGAKLRINDGQIAVTREFGTSLKGVAYFYDDSMAEGRVYARDFDKKKWFPMRWEADAIIFNPNGKDPIAIGTRTPKEKYMLHIEGNNKIDGHIYVAKKMKVGGKAAVNNMHTPRLNVKDDRGIDGNGLKPSENYREFIIGEWDMGGTAEHPLYELKAGGTNLRLGYYKDYCWMQMFPKGKSGSPLVLNGAGNSVGFGTTRPLTNLPGSGSAVKFHVEGNMMIDGNLLVKGEVSTNTMMETETLLDVGPEESSQMLHQLNTQKYTSPKGPAAHFGDSKMHDGAVSVAHIAATLTQSLQHHEQTLSEHASTLAKHDHRLAKLDEALSLAAKSL